MTKKHFIRLADQIRNYNQDIDTVGCEFTPMHIDFLADFCQSQNPNFNRQLWLDYIDGKCGPSGGKLK